MIESFEDIGQYLSMLTKVIAEYTDKFGNEFPLEVDNQKNDFISKFLEIIFLNIILCFFFYFVDLPELIANSNCLFKSTQKVYNSVSSVFPMLNKMVPFIALLFATIG